MLAVLAWPAHANAEWHFTPMFGVTFKGVTNFHDPEQTVTDARRNFGIAVSRFGEGILAFEGVVTLTPGFFEGAPVLGLEVVESSRLLLASGNVVLTTPRLWTEYSLRPFLSAGIGLLQARLDDVAEGPFTVNANVTGVNIGGGAIGFLSQRTGVRFEMRYHRAVGRPELPEMTIDGGPARLRFFTASIGLVIRTGRR